MHSKETDSENHFANHFLKLELHTTKEKKTIHLKKAPLIAGGLALALLFGTATTSLTSYLETKQALAASQTQLEEVMRTNKLLEQSAEQANTHVSEETLTQLQEQTDLLNEQLYALEQVKDGLNDQLETISDTDASSAEVVEAIASSLDTSDASLEFLPIITTSYAQADVIATQLAQIDAELSATNTAFITVAETATEALSAFVDIPSVMPVAGGIFSSGFDPNGSYGRVHNGADFSTRSQILPIIATASGTIVESEYHSGYGNYVTIDHGNGYQTLYAHNTENFVSVGDVVKQGDVIATTGSTGYSTGIHLHYEVLLNGIPQDPMLFMGE